MTDENKIIIERLEAARQSALNSGRELTDDRQKALQLGRALAYGQAIKMIKGDL